MNSFQVYFSKSLDLLCSNGRYLSLFVICIGNKHISLKIVIRNSDFDRYFDGMSGAFFMQDLGHLFWVFISMHVDYASKFKVCLSFHALSNIRWHFKYFYIQNNKCRFHTKYNREFLIFM